ncbi:MAG: hypothetical protein CME19_12525 [Gemmatimonadetes bacterium]|nr:hypothetical protein [Gemmatimonadota bacterium]
MTTYQVAILGCRSRGAAAGRAYHAHPRTEVVGLCDLLEERRNELGDELGVAARYADLDEMIRETEPHIVAIPTGTEFHFDLGMRVLEHGVHIDIEKPLCVDLEQADQLVALAAAQGSQIAVHHQGRTGASMRAVKAAYEGGKIGSLRYVAGSGKGYYGGYGLMNIGTHCVNAILELAGPCRSVFAHAMTGGKPVEPTDVVPSPGGMGTILGEHITASLVFDDGVTATLNQHRFETVDTRAYHAEFFGTEGRLFWRSGEAWWLPNPHWVPGESQTEWQLLTPDLPDLEPIWNVAIDDVLFVDEYVHALDEGRPHTSSGTEGLHVLEVLMGVFESAAYNTRVLLPQTHRDHPLLRWCEEAGVGAPEEMPRPYKEWLAVEDTRLGREPVA